MCPRSKISLTCLRFVSSNITLASSITGASSFTRAEGGERSGKFGHAGLEHRSSVALDFGDERGFDTGMIVTRVVSAVT